MTPRPQTVHMIWPASLSMTFKMEPTPYKIKKSSVGWLSRLCWWILHKRGALMPWFERVETWTYNPMAQGPLHEAMLAAMEDTYRNLNDIRADKAVFLIGGKDFSELCAAPTFRDVMTFRTGPFHHVDPYQGRHVYNIPIHVIPWMTGMCVVPRALIEKEVLVARGNGGAAGGPARFGEGGDNIVSMISDGLDKRIDEDSSF